MINKKYKIGKYNSNGKLIIKKKYIRKHKYNKTYANSLTKRRKNINEKKALIFLLISFIFGTTYAFAMTSNHIVIDGDMVIEHLPSEAVTLVVNSQPDWEEMDSLVASQSAGVEEVKQEIIKQARNFGLNEDMMLALATCENDTFDPERKNPTSTATGIYQFTEGTFLDGIRWRGLDWKLEDRTDVVKSINMAMWFIKRGELERWECAKILGYVKS